MQAILHDRHPIAKIVNATVISLEEAPKGYADFDSGAAKKFVLYPQGLLKASYWTGCTSQRAEITSLSGHATAAQATSAARQIPLKTDSVLLGAG
jgi:hypothetical protein